MDKMAADLGLGPEMICVEVVKRIGGQAQQMTEKTMCKDSLCGTAGEGPGWKGEEKAARPLESESLGSLRTRTATWCTGLYLRVSHYYSEVWFLYLLNRDINTHLQGLSRDFQIMYKK